MRAGGDFLHVSTATMMRCISSVFAGRQDDLAAPGSGRQSEDGFGLYDGSGFRSDSAADARDLNNVDDPTEHLRHTNGLGLQPPAAAGTLRVVPLGGLGEIGRNMAVLEYDGQLLIISSR